MPKSSGTLWRRLRYAFMRQALEQNQAFRLLTSRWHIRQRRLIGSNRNERRCEWRSPGPTVSGMNANQRQLRETFEAAEKKAKDLWADFSKAREEAATKGTISEDKTFSELTEAKKAYEEAAELAVKARASFMASLDGGGDNLGTKERLFGDWPKSLSDSFLENAGSKAFDVTSGGTATTPFYDAQIRELPQRRLFVRSLIPTKGIDNEKFDYLRQTVFTNNAAETAAGSAKPTSVISLERVEDRVRTIAHLSEPVDRSFLLDVDNLRDFIDGQLRLGVLLREDAQIVSGNGTGENLRGILNTSGILTQARGTDPHADTVLKAQVKLLAQANPFVANGLVLHPNDLQDVLLTRDANGNYQAADAGAVRVTDDGRVFIWGLEAIATIAIAEGTGLVGDFANGATVYDREQARVDWFESGGLGAAGAEIASRNQLVARGEERIGFAVHRPAAFCSLTAL
jgi:HK97 family phage major capsid protein